MVDLLVRHSWNVAGWGKPLQDTGPVTCGDRSSLRSLAQGSGGGGVTARADTIQQQQLQIQLALRIDPIAVVGVRRAHDGQ